MHKPLGKTKIKQLNKKTRQGLFSDLEIVFLLQDVTDPINVGAFFRIADAVGAERIIMTNNTPIASNQGVSLTSRGMERRIPWKYVQDPLDVIDTLRREGYQIIAVELTEQSIDYTRFHYSNKICLVMGNEARGVYKKTLSSCDGVVHIPMFGKGPSLNVHVAAAIVAYEAIAQHSK